MSPLLLLLLAPYLGSDLDTAARDLARTVSAAVAHEPVSLSIKNLSTLPANDTATIRRIFESELKSSPPPATEIRLTISENLTRILLVAEIQKSAERQVLMESWPRRPASATAKDQPARVMLEKKLLWEQDQPILDALQTGDAILVLDATRVLRVRGEERQTAAIPATHPWPRDTRGRLSASGAAFTAWLPGTICLGSAQPKLTIECHDSQDPWLLAPGAIATFASDRNLFAGHVALEPGGARELPPFYSAAPAGDNWIFAGIDGRAQVYSSTWEVTGAIDQWGSDIARLQTTCGERILANRPSGAHESDAIQPYEFSAGAPPGPAGPALEFSGPITALWSAGNSATAVSRDLQTGRYAAYSLAPNCGA